MRVVDTAPQTNDEPGDIAPRRYNMRVTAGFWAAVALALSLALASLWAIRAVAHGFGEVALEDSADLVLLQKLRIAEEVKGRAARSFLVTADPVHLATMQAANSDLAELASELRSAVDTPTQSAMLDRIERADREYQTSLDRVIALRRSDRSDDRLRLVFELEVQPARADVDRAYLDFASAQERWVRDARSQAKSTASRALALLISLAGFTVILSCILGLRLRRTLHAMDEQRREVARHVATVEALNRELDSFAGRVSHDLRNLLSPVAMAASLLPRSLDRPDRVRSIVGRIRAGVDRSLALMDGLLAFSRSGAPDPLASSPVAAVVNEVVDQVAPQAEQSRAVIERDVADCEVACSRELLSVILLNLVGNALKFVAGSERRVVSISARAKEDECEIVIADTGPGIPAESLPRVFEPFYRVPGTRVSGTGIGLATVARVVRAHGGSVDVKSTFGKGATFRIRLPLVDAETPPAASGRRARDPAPPNSAQA